MDELGKLQAPEETPAPVVKRKPGRPKGSKNKTAPSLPKVKGLPRLRGKELSIRPRAKDQEELEQLYQQRITATREALKIQVDKAADALSYLKNTPALGFLQKEVRLAWLCHQIHAQHFEHKPVSLGMLGYEIAEIPTDAPRFKAMEMLMRACGDFGGGPSTSVHVNTGAAAGDKGPQVVLITYDNGRGPALSERVPDVIEAKAE